MSLLKQIKATLLPSITVVSTLIFMMIKIISSHAFYFNKHIITYSMLIYLRHSSHWQQAVAHQSGQGRQ